MDSSHGHAVGVEIRVSPVPDGEGGSWRILGRVDPSPVSPLDSPSGTGSASASACPGQWHLPLSSVASRASGWARPCDWPMRRAQKRLGPSRSSASAWRSGRQHKLTRNKALHVFREGPKRGEREGLSTSVRKGTSQHRELERARVPCPSRRTCSYTVSVEADPELELGPKRSAASFRSRGILVLILGCFLLSVDGLVW